MIVLSISRTAANRFPPGPLVLRMHTHAERRVHQHRVPPHLPCANKRCVSGRTRPWDWSKDLSCVGATQNRPYSSMTSDESRDGDLQRPPPPPPPPPHGGQKTEENGTEHSGRDAGETSETGGAEMNSMEFLRQAAVARQSINKLWTQPVHARHPEQVISIFETLFSTGKTGPRAPAQPGHDTAPLNHTPLGGGKEHFNITRSLGEAADRLLLLVLEAQGKLESMRMEQIFQKDSSVPISGISVHTFQPLITELLYSYARSGTDLSIPLIQNAFAVCYNYHQALAFFETMRRCGIGMKMDSYYAMLFCLQRLEEESMGRDYIDEVQANGLTPEVMHYVLHGPQNQLLPEGKPHLGRVMFADTPAVYADSEKKGSDFDATGRAFRERYLSSV